MRRWKLLAALVVVFVILTIIVYITYIYNPHYYYGFHILRSYHGLYKPVISPGLRLKEHLLPENDAWGSRQCEVYTTGYTLVLPEYRGWYRFLKAGGTASLLATGPELILVSVGNLTYAVRVADGSLIWISAFNSTALDVLAVQDDYVLFNQRNPWVLRLTDGKVLGQASVVLPAVNVQTIRSDPSWKILVDRTEAEKPRCSVCAALQQYGYTREQCISVGKLHIALDSSDAVAGDDLHYHLFGLQRGLFGKPQPGALVNMTSSNLEPYIANFLQAPDPRANPVLMTQLVAAGSILFSELLKRFDGMDVPHQKALLALCEYRSVIPRSTADYEWKVLQLTGMEQELFLALQNKPDSRYSEALVALLTEARNGAVAVQAAATLARCGGPVARTALLAYYSGLQPARRIPLPRPYKLAPTTDPDDRDSHWAEFIGADGQHYAAFTSYGLACNDSIFIATGVQADLTCRDILFTGLSNTRLYALNMGSDRDFGQVKALGPLALELTGGVAQIKHHEAIFSLDESGTGDVPQCSIQGAKYMADRVSMADIQRDTDQDGLGDAIETSLLLKPDSADTDGDGICDGLDPLPNLDQSRLGYLERGVQRALIYALVVQNNDWPPDSGVPWCANYFYVTGSDPVAIADKPYGCGIVLASAADKKQYARLSKGGNRNGLLKVRVVDLRGQTKPKPGIGRLLSRNCTVILPCDGLQAQTRHQGQPSRSRSISNLAGMPYI